MNDIVNIRVLVKDSVESRFVGDIELDEFWALAADQLYSIEDLLGRIVEIVCDDDFVASFEESERCKRADVASATIRKVSVSDSRIKSST